MPELKLSRRAGFGLIASLFLSVPQSHAADLLAYVGTYTSGKSEGIYIYRMDLATGAMTRVGVATGVKNPSFLAIHPNRRFLYSVSEIADLDGKKTGGVTGFAIDSETGKLTMLNAQPSEGAGPCHLVVDRTGKSVLVANYGGGSVAALPIGEDGRLGKATAAIQHKGSSVNPGRQEAPHAHSINVDPTNRFAVAADLGLDKVLVYRLDAAKGTLEPNAPPSASVAPGAGPRHFAFHTNGRYAYVINEMHCTVTAFSYDAERGVLKEIQTLTTLPHEVREGYSTAEVQVHPSGKFLYGSNRGHDSIAIFSIDPSSGKLTAVGHQPTGGKTPRNFAIDPTGQFLLAENQGSDTIVVFRIDP
ncbi:MAG: lactonase family protein, partial [Planctomycetes bacterium]|nr:lactonase family protein [Planctomycetota bacterium]